MDGSHYNYHIVIIITHTTFEALLSDSGNQNYQLKRVIIKTDKLVLSSNILFSIRTHK